MGDILAGVAALPSFGDLVPESVMMTVAQYAKHQGVTVRAVNKALSTGRIHKNERGRIDPVAADRDWDANTNQATPQRGGPRRGSLAEAQAERIRHQAELLRLEVEERHGRLVERKAVDEVAYGLGRKVRDRILQAVETLSAELAWPDEVRLRAEEVFRGALESLADGAGPIARRRT